MGSLGVFIYHLYICIVYISCYLHIRILPLLFQFGYLFISFSCSIAVARTSNTMLNRSGKSRPLSHVSGFSRKPFIFSQLIIILAEGLS